HDALPTLEDHPEEVSAVSISADGREATSCCKRPSLKHWNVDSGEVSLRRALEADNIFVVSLSSNGQRVLVGSGEGDLRYFDVETNQLLSEFPSMGGLVRALAQTGDGHFAAATYHDAFYLLDLLSAETMIARYYSSFTQFSSLIGLAVAISED